MKKLLSNLLCVVIVFSSVFTVMASDEPVFVGEQSVSASSTGIQRASWGYLTLYWNGKDSAYAIMSTYAGTAYYLSARVSGIDRLGTIPSRENSSYDYKSSIISGTIVSRDQSGQVSWWASGAIADTPTSGAQYADVGQVNG